METQKKEHYNCRNKYLLWTVLTNMLRCVVVCYGERYSIEIDIFIQADW